MEQLNPKVIFDPESAAVAALFICDLLLLELVNEGVLGADQVVFLLQKIADSQRTAASTVAELSLHSSVADVVEAMIKLRVRSELVGSEGTLEK